MTGFICFDKAENITSFFAVKKLSRLLGEKKAGHTGTLDPMATGVMTVALGGATRFIELMPSHEKAYTAVIKFGISTDTLDITGNVLETSDKKVSREEFENVLENFRGDIMQVPPMYSAIKKDGVRLYDLARKGIEVEREERKVTIKKLELISFNENENEFTIDVLCSGGTYIRSLCSDIGEKLGVPCTMKSLRRTMANNIDISKCLTLSEIEKLCEEGREKEIITAVDEALCIYEKINVSAKQAVRFKNGGELDADRIKYNFNESFYRVYSPENLFLGIGEYVQAENSLKVKRVYNEI
ncbi:MAG: tRNA pseudouridine(55) synthase TruB [Ruminococcaceae bacterium]|nr:tRNA pseudouridine(55) synthase TruB [Oscillospiraceae bacterium]